MGVLDQVMQLKKQGYAEQDIMNNLQQQGVSPKQITDAINQSNIKSAVSNPEEPGKTQAPPTPNEEATSAEGYYTPQTQPVQQGYTQAPEYYEEGAYAPYGEIATTGMDSDTIIEIANQVFSEKIRKTEKRLEELEELKTVMKVKVDSIDERLKRIEKMIDALQVQVLEKVGSYGKELERTKKEVSMLEDTVGKTIKTKVKSSVKHKKTSKRKTASRKKK